MPIIMHKKKKFSGGTSYTEGNGIDITNDVISIDDTIATKGELADTVSNIIGTEDVWNPTTTYSVGDMVIYNDSAYSCIVANSGQVPTDATHWEVVSLKELNSKLNGNNILNILSSPVTLAIRENTSFVTTKNFEKGKTYIFVIEDSYGHGECDCTVFYYNKSTIALSLLYYIYGNSGTPSEAIAYTGYVNLNSKILYYASLKGSGGSHTFVLKAILEK